jgi:hypothetical protein
VLAIPEGVILSVAGEFVMQDLAHYNCQFGGLLSATGDLDLAGRLSAQVMDKSGILGYGAWGYGSRTIMTTAEPGRIDGAFQSLPLLGAHLGFGVFFQGITYSYHQGAQPHSSVSVDAFQAKPGDTDGDRDVDFTDFNNLANGYTGVGGSGKVWTQGDFDADGDVDFADFNKLANNYTGPITGYAKGKSGGGLDQAQRAELLGGLEGMAPGEGGAAEVGESLARWRVRIALARLATLRATDVARAGTESVSARDAVLEQLGRQESRTPRTSTDRTAWLCQFEPTGVKERPAKANTLVETVADKLLVTDRP